MENRILKLIVHSFVITLLPFDTNVPMNKRDSATRCPSTHCTYNGLCNVLGFVFLWICVGKCTHTITVTSQWSKAWQIANTLQWRHNGHDGVSNDQPHDCLLNRLFRHRSKKTSKLRVTGLCAVNSPVTGDFPAQWDSNTENITIWWRHHDESTKNYSNNNTKQSTTNPCACSCFTISKWTLV